MLVGHDLVGRIRGYVVLMGVVLKTEMVKPCKNLSLTYESSFFSNVNICLSLILQLKDNARISLLWCCYCFMTLGLMSSAILNMMHALYSKWSRAGKAKRAAYCACTKYCLFAKVLFSSVKFFTGMLLLHDIEPNWRCFLKKFYWPIEICNWDQILSMAFFGYWKLTCRVFEFEGRFVAHFLRSMILWWPFKVKQLWVLNIYCFHFELCRIILLSMVFRF